MVTTCAAEHGRPGHVTPAGRWPPGRRLGTPGCPAVWAAPGPCAHRAVPADALAALDGLLVGTQGRHLAVKRAQLDVHAQVVVEVAGGAELGLAAAPVLARARLAVGVERAGLACAAGRGRERTWQAAGTKPPGRRERVQPGQAVRSAGCRGHCCCCTLTPAARQAAGVDAAAVDVRLAGVLDTVVAGGAEGTHIALALVALAVLVFLAGLQEGRVAGSLARRDPRAQLNWHSKGWVNASLRTHLARPAGGAVQSATCAAARVTRVRQGN